MRLAQLVGAVGAAFTTTRTCQSKLCLCIRATSKLSINAHWAISANFSQSVPVKQPSRRPTSNANTSRNPQGMYPIQAPTHNCGWNQICHIPTKQATSKSRKCNLCRQQKKNTFRACETKLVRHKVKACTKLAQPQPAAATAAATVLQSGSN